MSPIFSKMFAAAPRFCGRSADVVGLARRCPTHGRGWFHAVTTRSTVSLPTLIDRTENVMPLYSMVEQQMKPQITQDSRPGESSKQWLHSVSWTLADGQKLSFERPGQSKRQAKNAAARALLRELAVTDTSTMDPSRNAALAQWAVTWINEKLDATMELAEETPAPQDDAEAPGMDEQSPAHICTWSCPQLDQKLVSRGVAQSAGASRREAITALYKTFPDELERIIAAQVAEVDASSGTPPAAPVRRRSGREGRASEMNARHNEAVQQLGIDSKFHFKVLEDKQHECTLKWSVWDQETMSPKETIVQGLGRSKAAAKAHAAEEMMVQQGLLPRLSEEFYTSVAEVHEAILQARVSDAVEPAVALMKDEQNDLSAMSIFLPDVLRALLVEGDDHSVHVVLETLQDEVVRRGGAPVDLWERLLNEASYALRHYQLASYTLETLRDIPLPEDAFPSDGQRQYFAKFRQLLALERQGDLISGIDQYQLDPAAMSRVPTVDVHQMEGAMVVMTSTASMADSIELVEGSRSLRTGDIVLLIPKEVAMEGEAAAGDEDLFDDQARQATNWRHPEAWLASVTNVKGNPEFGEEVKVHTRRISPFGSDVQRLEDGSSAAISPITIGRQYQLFSIAMETPLARQLSALRCLTEAKLPVWSPAYEGRKPSYRYSKVFRELLVASPEEAKALALEPPRQLDGLTSEAAVQALIERRPWVGTMTASQIQAIQGAFDQRLSLIQGPPGTGKTHVACGIIAAWMDRYGMQGDRILAVADSNVAADNLHLRLRSFGVDSVRIGQTKELEKGLYGQELRRAIKDARIVIATCIGSGMEALDSPKDGTGRYVRVVIDECTQACEPAAIVALGRECEQAVFIGDHKQLPATVLSKLAAREGLGISVFERMVNSGAVVPTMLEEQRRMHSSISEFPNGAFYDNKLKNAISDDLLAPVPGFPWPNPDCRVAFVDVFSGDGAEGKRGFSAYNSFEAEAVAQTVGRMIQAGAQPYEIGVLTAYLAQKNEIVRALQRQGLGHVLPELTVDTVDGYQGMEREIILFSATRSNASRQIGFLGDARRMNVMLTRAKRGVVVFGDGDTLRHSSSFGSHWPAWIDWVESKKATLPYGQLSEQPAASQASGDQSQSSQSPQAAPAAPSPWQKVYSDQYSAHYYWNISTGVTQWEVPEGYVDA
eukprot:TRINITY_DN12071_c0_g1_i1.p1 TRINITY_DN12071_c0_g1~~TRINITY_DN12071_c0_g1_i1.p1  ORF type:complete len:1173 (+),score=286.64 TRINITY_DN12071_c0_g1_i1:80-3598(+)